MARLATFPAKVRRRGNPNWCRGGQPIPNLPTAFEKEVRRLGLKPEAYLKSAELRAWCDKNRDRLYIPELLLKAWGLTVDTWEDTTPRAA